jgi:hypothetical protein
VTTVVRVLPGLLETGQICIIHQEDVRFDAVQRHFNDRCGALEVNRELQVIHGDPIPSRDAVVILATVMAVTRRGPV